MKKYKVTLHTDMVIYAMVDAENREQAKEFAMRNLSNRGVNEMHMNGQRVTAEIAADEVVFRSYKGQVMAIFPEYVPDEDGKIPCYTMRHELDKCDFDEVYNNSTESSEEEYQPLFNHMTQKGYNLHVMNAEKAQEIINDDGDNENIASTKYGNASLKYCNDGHGGYFEVYVRSNPKTQLYDLFVGTINDSEDDNAMYQELLELLADFYK